MKIFTKINIAILKRRRDRMFNLMRTSGGESSPYMNDYDICCKVIKDLEDKLNENGRKQDKTRV